MSQGARIAHGWRARLAAVAARRMPLRRRLLIGSDVIMTLLVLMAIAVFATLFISHGDAAVMGPAAQSSPFTAHLRADSSSTHPPAPPQRLTALEHSRAHLHPGYRCPLHPEVFSESPGRCPICGEVLLWNGASPVPLEKSAVAEPGLQRVRKVRLYGSGRVDRLLVKQAGGEVQQGELLLELFAPGLLEGSERLERLARLYSPVTGRVRSIAVREGEYATSGMVVMEVEDGASIWLKSALSPAEAGRVHAGQSAELILPGVEGTMLVGEVDELVPMRDGQGQRLAWLRFDDDPRLRSLGAVMVRIHARAAGESGLPPG